MREVRVYDHDFPTREQILSGDPDAAFPKEVWLQQMQPGEFAVRYKDFKTGLARNPAGEHVQSSEICRIFGDLEEARADSRTVANDHWVVRCVIYDHAGAEVDTVSNTKQVSKFAAAMYAPVLLGIALWALGGMGLIWLIYKIWRLIAGPASPAHNPVVFGWLYWMSFVSAGLLVAILVWYLRVQFAVRRTVSQMQGRLNAAISPDEKKRFEELNTLHGTSDPVQRERYVKLLNEYQEKVREALKK